MQVAATLQQLLGAAREAGCPTAPLSSLLTHLTAQRRTWQHFTRARVEHGVLSGWVEYDAIHVASGTVLLGTAPEGLLSVHPAHLLPAMPVPRIPELALWQGPNSPSLPASPLTFKCPPAMSMAGTAPTEVAPWLPAPPAALASPEHLLRLQPQVECSHGSVLADKVRLEGLPVLASPAPSSALTTPSAATPHYPPHASGDMQAGNVYIEPLHGQHCTQMRQQRQQQQKRSGLRLLPFLHLGKKHDAAAVHTDSSSLALSHGGHRSAVDGNEGVLKPNPLYDQSRT